MNSNNNGNKTLGIGIAIAAVLGVGVVTAAKEHANNQNAVLGTDTTVTDESQLNQNDSQASGVVAQVQPSDSGASLGSSQGDDENDEYGDAHESDEGEDGYTGSSQTSQQPSVPSTSTGGTTTPTALYKDGTYTTTVSYMSPGGFDKLGVSITISKGIVSNSSATAQPGNGTSAEYENAFVQSYKPYVVGKSIATLSVMKIAGASLTSHAFNTALGTIRTQAKA